MQEISFHIGHLYRGKEGPLGSAVYWQPSELINAHLVMTGDSGSGKTHTLRNLCRQVVESAGPGLERVHVLDSHGDIDVPSSTIRFSQSTPYAFNPLEVFPDPHFGGVRRAISNFIGLLKRSSKNLGTTQEAVLRNVLLQVFEEHGFNPDDPSTWYLDQHFDAELNSGGVGDKTYIELPYEEKEIAKSIAKSSGVRLQFDGEVKAWWVDVYDERFHRWPPKSAGKSFPTIHDVLAKLHFKRKQLFSGTDQKGLLALMALGRAQISLMAKAKSTRLRASQATEDELQAERDRAAEKALEAVKSYIEQIATGKELDELVQYENKDTLTSLIDRLENLKATGVCRSVSPPMDPTERIWRYELRAYGDDEKRIFVENFLERLFQRVIARGEIDRVTDIIVIDEAPKYMCDESDHIITKLVNESRKFGIALILVAQSPTQYPEEILAGVGCKIVLGLDPMYHRTAATKLAIDARYISAIVPRSVILVNHKPKGQVARWLPVCVGN